MATESSYPMSRERNIILASLLVLAAVAWIILIWQSSDTQMMGLTMGMDAPVFLAIWIVMMIAMMFPAAAPMILTFARVHNDRREKGKAFVPTWVFVSAYLLIWTLFGVVAYAAALGIEMLAQQSMWLMDHAARIAGVVLILAGVYQLTPLKYACLSKCRSPLGFIMSSWREGYLGSFRMGLEHGLFCFGCCWFLFVILFPLGIMNIAAMAIITVLIFAEKSLAYGVQIAHIAAIALIVYGMLVIAMPSLLPTMMQ